MVKKLWINRYKTVGKQLKNSGKHMENLWKMVEKILLWGNSGRKWRWNCICDQKEK